MEYLAPWLLLASVNLAATISPGPAFAITVRQAIAHDRRAGLLTVLGLGMGVGVHVTLVLLGMAAIISQSLLLFTLIKYAGAGYLLYMGAKALMAKPKIPEAHNSNGEVKSLKKHVSDWGAFQAGVLTNVLSPKALIFFTAVYTQLIGVDTPPEVLVLYGLTSVMIEITWFSAVTLVLTNARVKNGFLSVSHWVERLCGGLLVFLGVKLAFSKA